jgi:hypothetical protein
MPRFDSHLTAWAQLEGIPGDDLARALDRVAPEVVTEARVTPDHARAVPLDLRPVGAPAERYPALLGLEPRPA